MCLPLWISKIHLHTFNSLFYAIPIIFVPGMVCAVYNTPFHAYANASSGLSAFPHITFNQPYTMYIIIKAN